MGMRVVVDAAADFDRWVAAQRAPPREPSDGDAAAGKAIFAAERLRRLPHRARRLRRHARARSHALRQPRVRSGAGMFPNTPERLDRVGAQTRRALKPGAKMPPFAFTDEQARALAAYLASLK